MTEPEFALMKWNAPDLCNASATIKVLGYDNGDGDGPHYFSLEVETQAEDFGSEISISVRNLEALKSLSESFARAYHKALSLIESRTHQPR